MSRLLIVFGDKTADEILPIAQQRYSEQFDEFRKYFFDPSRDHDKELTELARSNHSVHFVVGVVDIRLRVKIQQTAIKAGFEPFTVIHRSADIAESATIGRGCFVGPQAVISVNATVGDFSIVHIHSSIGHNSRLGKGSTVLPGARISGDVTLGDEVLVGSNAFVYQGVTVGAGSQIDALTYVRDDLPSGMLASCRLSRPVKRADWSGEEETG